MTTRYRLVRRTSPTAALVGLLCMLLVGAIDYVKSISR